MPWEIPVGDGAFGFNFSFDDLVVLCHFESAHHIHDAKSIARVRV